MINEKEIFAQIQNCKIPVVTTIAPVTDVRDLIDHTKPLIGVEGYVVAFDTGYRVKIKADHYLRIHGALDKIRFDYKIIDMWLHGQLDDVYGELDDNNRRHIDNLLSVFTAARIEILDKLKFHINSINEQGLDKKSVALQYVPENGLSDYAKIIFGAMDGRDCQEEVDKFIANNLGSGAKWDRLQRWLGIP